MDKKHIYKLVLTGGPCSGKTTALEELKSFLTKHGFKVFTTPEAATTLFLNGCSIADFSVPNAAYTFQIGVLTYVTLLLISFFFIVAEHKCISKISSQSMP